MTKQASIGSISTGTLREPDLLRAFAASLYDLQKDTGDRLEMCAEAERIADALDDNPDDTGYQDDAAGMLEDLQDALQEYAPPFCYFGAHEGDGADFGFWPSHDAIRDAIHDDEILEVCDHRNARRRDMPQYVYHINDHGNATLYRIELVEEWSIV